MRSKWVLLVCLSITGCATPKDGVVLLGKIAKSDSSTIRMEYMLVDTRNAESPVVSTPAIIARIGEEA